ncbi:unnamed protein product, partial [Polarella glacialis]
DGSVHAALCPARARGSGSRRRAVWRADCRSERRHHCGGPQPRGQKPNLAWRDGCHLQPFRYNLAIVWNSECLQPCCVTGAVHICRALPNVHVRDCMVWLWEGCLRHLNSIHSRAR